MGLFNWFRSNKQEASDGSSSAEGKGIEAVYSFLQTDFEPKGYNDALINPDQSNKADGIRMIRSHLSIILDKSMNHYEKLIRDLDYHVKSRSDAGLVDLVEELKAQKEKALTDIRKIRELEEQMNSNAGLFENIILSYEQGFKRGLAAITKSKFQ